MCPSILASGEIYLTVFFFQNDHVLTADSAAARLSLERPHPLLRPMFGDVAQNSRHPSRRHMVHAIANTDMDIVDVMNEGVAPNPCKQLLLASDQKHRAHIDSVG